MPHTCIVSALEGSPLGEQYAALATACSIGERVRDTGGAALVILDDVSCMVRTLSPAIVDLYTHREYFTSINGRLV